MRAVPRGTSVFARVAEIRDRSAVLEDHDVTDTAVEADLAGLQ